MLVTATLVSETIQLNGMILSRIMKHTANLAEFARFQLIINMWIEMTILGALTVKPYVKCLPGTKKLKLLGQRIGYNGDRSSFGAGSCNFSNSVATCGLSVQMDLISEIVSVIKLTSMLSL